MKYLTKEWYNLMQQTYHHLGLEYDERAAFYSEKYYLELYNEKMHMALEEGFDSKKYQDAFLEGHRQYVQVLKDMLPERITKYVVDIRVLSLGKATKIVIDLMTQFCTKNKEKVKLISDKYFQYYSSIKNDSKFEFTKKLHFHDCTILGIDIFESDLIMRIENDAETSKFSEIRFKNYSILHQEGDVGDLCWIYHEVYGLNEKFQLHILLVDDREMGCKLSEITIEADEIVVDHI